MSRNGWAEFPDFRGVGNGVLVEHKTETGAINKLEFVLEDTVEDTVIVVESVVANILPGADLLQNPELDW